jgi:hypothetical protein
MQVDEDIRSQTLQEKKRKKEKKKNPTSPCTKHEYYLGFKNFIFALFVLWKREVLKQKLPNMAEISKTCQLSKIPRKKIQHT